jgi:hypothetical protein
MKGFVLRKLVSPAWRPLPAGAAVHGPSQFDHRHVQSHIPNPLETEWRAESSLGACGRRQRVCEPDRDPNASGWFDTHKKAPIPGYRDASRQRPHDTLR